MVRLLATVEVELCSGVQLRVEVWGCSNGERTVKAELPLCLVKRSEHLQQHLPDIPRVRKLAVFEHLQWNRVYSGLKHWRYVSWSMSDRHIITDEGVCCSWRGVRLRMSGLLAYQDATE